MEVDLNLVMYLVLFGICFYLRYRLFESNKMQYAINVELVKRVSELECNIDKILKCQIIDLEARLDRVEDKK